MSYLLLLCLLSSLTLFVCIMTSLLTMKIYLLVDEAELEVLVLVVDVLEAKLEVISSVSHCKREFIDVLLVDVVLVVDVVAMHNIL